MTRVLPIPEWLDDMENVDDPDTEEIWAWATLDGDRPPTLADHFHITDPQHWLDLCA
jgi:hypothetical protein